MISSLRGIVLHVGTDSAVIETGGIGFAFSAAPATLADLREGKEARVATSLVVREDSLTLFGFADDEERAVFEILQSVSGIGPRTALAILAVHTPDALRAEVAAENTAALQRVPGIGKKGAQRMIIELAGKLGPARGGGHASATPAPAGGDDVVQALMNFGWNEAESYAAYDEARKVNPEADVAGLLRASLQIMNSRRS